MKSMLKVKIKKSFNKACVTYDEACSVQKKACRELINLLSSYKTSFHNVADMACGTGISTQYLNQQFKYEKLYAIDIAENLLLEARKKLNNEKVKFILEDFDTPLFQSNYLDLIFCNMGLQWSLNFNKTLELFKCHLIPHGLMAFAMPVHGTLEELKQGCRNSNYKVADIKNSLMKADLTLIHFQQKAYVEKFNTQLDAIRSIKAIGANCNLERNTQTIRGIAKKNLNNIFIKPTDLTLTYQIGFFIVKKGDNIA